MNEMNQMNDIKRLTVRQLKARWLKWVFLLLLCLGGGLFLSPVHSQSEGEWVFVQVESIDTQAFPQVRLRLSVVDDRGRPLTDLRPEHFSLTEDGQSVSVSSVEKTPPQEVNLNIALALDISGSIEENLEQIKKAAIRFVEKLEPADQVSLVFFGATARVVEPLALERGRVVNHISTLSPATLEDYTALYNGAIESINLVADQDAGRGIVVLMTDGRNTTAPGNATHSLEEVRQMSSNRGVPIYVIGVRSSDLSEQDLRQMSSNGRYYPVDRPTDLMHAFDSVGADLRHRYDVSFVSSLPQDGQEHQLTIVATEPDLGTSAPVNVPFRTAPGPPPPAGSPPITATTTTTPAVSAAFPVFFTEPAEDATVAPDEEISVSVTIETDTPASLELFLDNELVISDMLSSDGEARTIWDYSWTPEEELSEEEHTLEVRVLDQAGQQATSTRTFQVEEGSIVSWLWVFILVAGLSLLTIAGLLLFWQQRKQSTTRRTR
jgi:VWFA-related protein